MDTIPNTINYMVAGYAVIVVAMLIYFASLALRFRNLHQDEEMLNQLEEKEAAAPPKPMNATPQPPLRDAATPEGERR